MGELIGIAAGILIAVVICRSIAAAFPKIRYVIMLMPWVAAIAAWAASGFWYGVGAFISSAIVLGILFGSETEAEDYRKSSHRPRKGIACKNCGSTDTYKISPGEKSELCEFHYRENDYKGTIADAYRCSKCGHHTWFDYDGQIYYTHD